jgi:hypothetical protein
MYKLFLRRDIMYALEQGLVDLINAQRAEAEEFSKQEGCFMGMMPEATELAYYMLCDAYSKSYARNLRLSVFTDEELEAEIEAAGNMIAMQQEAQCS